MALAGAQPITGGRIRLDREPARLSNPGVALSHGIALVPEDRQREGLLLSHTIQMNLSLSILDGLRSAFRLLSFRREQRLTAEVAETTELKARSLGDLASALSGGNQQKVVLGRVLLTEPRVLLLFDPTRGVDVGTKSEIFQVVADLARRGVAVVFFSTELAELIHMCHRIAVMVEGNIRAIVPAATTSEEEILGLLIRPVNNAPAILEAPALLESPD
jgi:ABC-type sugar transport system ATPase subunit